MRDVLAARRRRSVDKEGWRPGTRLDIPITHIMLYVRSHFDAMEWALRMLRAPMNFARARDDDRAACMPASAIESIGDQGRDGLR